MIDVTHEDETARKVRRRSRRRHHRGIRHRLRRLSQTSNARAAIVIALALLMTIYLAVMIGRGSG